MISFRPVTDVFVTKGENLDLVSKLPDQFGFNDAVYTHNNVPEPLAKCSRSNGHDGSMEVTCVPFRDVKRINISSFSPTTASLHIPNVTKTDSGFYHVLIKRFTPVEESFLPDDTNHTHTGLEIFYARFNVKVRTPVKMNIEIQPKMSGTQLVMGETYFVVCSEEGGDPKLSTPWANLVDDVGNRATSLKYLPDSEFYKNSDDGMSRAYQLQLTAEDAAASVKGQLYLECGLEQVWQGLKKISNITSEPLEILHAPIVIAPIEKIFEWKREQTSISFEFFSNPRIETLQLGKMGDNCAILIEMQPLETSRYCFNLTEDSIKHWESFCNETAWSEDANLTLVISNYMGAESWMIQLIAMKTTETAQPTFDYTYIVYAVFGSGSFALILVFIFKKLRLWPKIAEALKKQPKKTTDDMDQEQNFIDSGTLRRKQIKNY